RLLKNYSRERSFLECGDLSPLSYGLPVKILVICGLLPHGAKAATSRRTPNFALLGLSRCFQQPARGKSALSPPAPASICWISLNYSATETKDASAMTVG